MKITFIDHIPSLLEKKSDPKVVNLAQVRADKIMDLLETGGAVQLRDKEGKLQTVRIKGEHED